MQTTNANNRRELFATGIASAVIASALSYWLTAHTPMSEELRMLQERNMELQAKLEELQWQARSAQDNIKDRSAQHDSDVAPKNDKNNQLSAAGTMTVTRGPGSIQILKGLESDSTDTKSPSDKLQDLLSGNPDKEKIAIASRFIFLKSKYPLELPDDALQSLFASHNDPDLRRVIAQVMSQRGNNTYINNQIAELRSQLNSNQAVERQQALSELGKTHYIKAAEVIAPLLQDADPNVRLSALFALRDTGNQRHVELANNLINDTDPSVSALAAEVGANLKNLSLSARTMFSRSDIESELPPLANP